MDDNIHVQIMKFDTTFKDQISAMAEEAKEEKRNAVMLGSAIAAVLVLAGAMVVLIRRSKRKF